VCKSVSKLVENGPFESLEYLAEKVAHLALGQELRGEWVKVSIEKPRALLRADAAGISIIRRRDGETVKKEGEDRVFVKDLRLVTIIGVNPWEREERQNVIINLTLHKPTQGGGGVGGFDKGYDFRAITNTVSEYVEKSDYKTVEAFVTALAKEACVTCGVSKVTVRAEKPSALTFAKAAGVEITRERSFFELEQVASGKGGTHDVFVALGSNLGDRYKNINDAVVEMERRGLKVKKTSSLYQSAPMYVTDQPTFLNGVCQVFVSSTFPRFILMGID
jgi:dihydroneopterin aldolase/2-amino-4-hydroxy-6-hydroxymethyldihydropteridine diphosphokinase/dihydropteroate synthase